MDVQKQKKILADQSEMLLNEMETIYLSGAWRNDPIKVEREREIKKLLADNFAEARKLPEY